MDWSFDLNRSRPESAGDWLVFYFTFPFVQFLFFGLVMGPDTALKAFLALTALGLAYVEVNFLLERRESQNIESVRARARDTRKVAAVVCSAILAAYAVQTSVFPSARLGVGQALVVLVVALVAFGIYNNRKPRP